MTERDEVDDVYDEDVVEGKVGMLRMIGSRRGGNMG